MRAKFPNVQSPCREARRECLLARDALVWNRFSVRWKDTSLGQDESTEQSACFVFGGDGLRSDQQRVVSFGGYDGSSYHDDTWLFDGTTWTQVFSANMPPARAAAAISFDQATGNLIMFGGFNGGYLGDT